MNNEHMNFPASFRIIGIGNGVDEIINNVRSFGFDGVSAEVINIPFECTPSDENKLAIIVSINNDDHANRIAKSFHKAGVLTIGFSEDADTSCYDSVIRGVSSADYAGIIKAILQPVATPGYYICYDFSDLSTALRDTGFFLVKSAIGDSVKECVANIQTDMKNVSIEEGQCLLTLYFNRERPEPDISSLSELRSFCPESVDVIWSLHLDDSLNDNQIRLDMILAGREVWKCSKI